MGGSGMTNDEEEDPEADDEWGGRATAYLKPLPPSRPHLAQ